MCWKYETYHNSLRLGKSNNNSKILTQKNFHTNNERVYIFFLDIPFHFKINSLVSLFLCSWTGLILSQLYYIFNYIYKKNIIKKYISFIKKLLIEFHISYGS